MEESQPGTPLIGRSSRESRSVPRPSASLLEARTKAYRRARRDSADTPDSAEDNRLIRGDNLSALLALMPEFGERIKCAYLDPPYNSGSTMQHYDDGLDHATWLGMMRDRLELVRGMLRPDGFVCCHIDDAEGHYLKILMDEVFGRRNYLTTIYLQVRYPTKTLKQDMHFHKQIEYVHVYRKTPEARPVLPRKRNSFEKFRFYVDELGSGKETSLGGKRVVIFGKEAHRVLRGEASSLGLKEIWATGTILDGNSSGRFFRDFLTGRSDVDGLGVLYKVYGIGDDRLPYRYFTGPKRDGATKGKYYQGVPLARLESNRSEETTPIENFHDLAGSFGNCRHEGGVDFRGGKKPEALLHLLLKHFSGPTDWVLDCFAGSGTTGAVAHKMNRRWIMIERGKQCDTHVAPRMKSVIDGTDLTGITSIARWTGGGGFRCFRARTDRRRRDVPRTRSPSVARRP